MAPTKTRHTTRARIAAGTVALAAGLSFGLPAATAFAAPDKPAPTISKEDRAKANKAVSKLKTVDFESFLKGVVAEEGDSEQGASAAKILGAYSKLSDDQKVVANAVNVTQLAAKKYGEDSPEAQFAKAGLFSLQVADGLLKVGSSLLNGSSSTPGTTPTLDSTGKPSTGSLIEDATFSPDREDDPIWGADSDTPDPTAPSFQVKQNPERPVKK